MRNEDVCPRFKNCPIFFGELLNKKSLYIAYREQFCEAGKLGYKKCKRYMVSEIIGKPVPLKIMPNSILSTDEIIEMIDLLED